MTKLELLQELTDLRSVWPHEALDFTPWLAEEENIALLGNAIGLDITIDETESDVGDFHVDIVATETGTDRKIIIENQLEDTDHDHLGKLITYTAGKEASVIVWLVKKARDEHKAAIEWLNAHTDATIGFFLCEIKLYQIGSSAPAVKFEVIERPNNWAKVAKQVSDKVGKTEQQRLEYWQAYTDYVSKDPSYTKQFKIETPSCRSWLNHYLGSSLCHISINQIRKSGEIIVEIYISNNKSFYKKLEMHKDEIEKECGFELEWRELPNKKASRILITRPADFDDMAAWENHFEWIKQKNQKLKTAIKKYL